MDVDPNLYIEFTHEVVSILDVLEAGDRPDPRQLSRSFGTAAEYLLCDLFRMHPAASKYWIDGVEVDVASIHTRRVLRIQGRAWCADHRTQWLVPAEFIGAFSEAEPAALLSTRIRMGNAAFLTLGGHRDRDITRRELREWLIEFEIGMTDHERAETMESADPVARSAHATSGGGWV